MYTHCKNTPDVPTCVAAPALGTAASQGSSGMSLKVYIPKSDTDSVQNVASRPLCISLCEPNSRIFHPPEVRVKCST